MNLECSSKGDKRFSAMYARIELCGRWDTIESHYQLAKRFGTSPPPTHWKQCKGRRPTHFVWNGINLPLTKLTDFYNYLWSLYLDANPHLVGYLTQFSSFTDCFARSGCNNQAKAIQLYMDKL